MNPVEDMQIFKRIVEAGSISKAAAQLDTVKSAVSRRLKELEKRLNVTLLQRTTRRQMLTEAGQRYYQSCLRLLDDIAEAEAQVTDTQSELAGQLRIAVPLSFGLQHLSQVLLDFQQQHPQLQLDIDFSDRFVDLVADGFDLAIRIGQLPDSSLKARRLSHSRIMLCASPAYLQQYGKPTHPEDLAKGHIALHYRSRHESLIAVSNYVFYDNKLVVFPNPDTTKRDLGLVFHHLPDTDYDRGKSRTNPKEALARSGMKFCWMS